MRTMKNSPMKSWGCEDARLTYLEERGEYVIAYTGYSPRGAGICLATTKDFRKVKRYGLVIAPNNKDAAIFPRKIGGKYWMLHRPMLGGQEHIWLTESEDLIHWGKPWCIIEERGGPWWDGDRVGTGPVPIETPEGWLLDLPRGQVHIAWPDLPGGAGPAGPGKPAQSA